MFFSLWLSSSHWEILGIIPSWLCMCCNNQNQMPKQLFQSMLNFFQLAVGGHLTFSLPLHPVKWVVKVPPHKCSLFIGLIFSHYSISSSPVGPHSVLYLQPTLYSLAKGPGHSWSAPESTFGSSSTFPLIPNPRNTSIL